MEQFQQTNPLPTDNPNQTLAISSIPCQKWNGTYDLTTALQEGTIFPELNLPFYMGGKNYGK